jgi:anti-sigma factor RsiW
MADATHGGVTCGEVRDLATPFVLGILEPDEAARVREHLATCPESHAEIVELGATIPALARSVEIAQPSADLGPRILAAARAEQAEGIASGAIAPQAPDPAPVPASRKTAIPADRRGSFGFLDALRRPRLAFAGLVAMLAIAVLGAWNLQLQGQVGDLTAYRAAVAAIESAATASGTQPILLGSGTSVGGAAGLAAFDNTGRLVIAMRDLPPTSGTQVYEAWVIGANGSAMPAGSFVVGSSGTGTLTAAVGDYRSFSAVALTREAGPGAATPTLPIIVQGQVSSSSS